MIKRYSGDEALFLLAQFEEMARGLRRLGLAATIPPFDPACDTLAYDESGVDGSGRHPLWYVEYGAVNDTRAITESQNLQVDAGRLISTNLPNKDDV